MKNLQPQKGMTLMEMMVSLSILMLVILSVFPLIDGMAGRFQMARDHYVATSLAKSRIERARMAPFSDLNLFVEPINQPTYLNALGETEQGGRFKRTTLITTNSPSAGLTTMTVSTYICICSRYGWRTKFHPVNNSTFTCRFTEEKEELNYIFTLYNK
jgi:prepilin-type N-terminal cleavage/methylation domain-containing protein